MTERRRFAQVDVFTDTPLLGNPVAVVLDGEGLSPEVMRRFAVWTNLSESTFVSAPTHPDADYALRIFTPERELPFAGHPTLGSCHAWLRAGGRPKGTSIVQECGAGLIEIRYDEASGELAFAAPPRQRSGPLDDDAVHALAEGLRIEADVIVDHQWCDNGPPWQALLLPSADAVLDLQPDATALSGEFVGVVGRHGPGSDADFEVRAFFPTGQGMGEDPVTGSLNAALGQWLIGSGRVPGAYVVAQGTRLGRAGRVSVTSVGDRVWIGGRCVVVLDGSAIL
jgi:PhzF family phenazine biosynthesis protein